MPGAVAPPSSAQGRAWGARIQGGSAVGTVLTALMPANVSATTVQWTRNGTDIPGATGPTYTTTDADGGQAISYRYVPVVAAGVSVTVAAAIVANLERNAIAAARRNNAALWYIPDSLGGVYQDSAGTTLPALNAPIGLLLDRSYGAETLGPDALNGIGAFDSSAGWTGGGGWTVAGGVATNSGVSADLTAAINVVRGRQYVVSFRLTSYTAGANAPGIHNGVGAFVRGSIARYSTLGTCTEVLTATADGASTIVINAASPCSIDDLTVREVIAAANLGPELALPFATTDWNVSAGWTFNGGTATFAGGADSNVSTKTNSFLAGRHYRISFNVVTLGNGFLRLRVGATGVTDYTPTFVGVHTINCYAEQDGPLIFRAESSTTGFSINGLSAREVLGYHAAQATAANKPTLTRVPRKLGPERATGAWSVAAGYDNVISANSPSSFTSTGGATANRVTKMLEALTVGKTYWLTLRVASANAGTVGVYVREGSTPGAGVTTYNNPAVIQVGQMFTASFIATSATANILFVGTQGSAQNYAIDSISLDEVLEWSYALNFDRVNDVLASTLLCGDAGTVIAAHQVSTVTGAWQALVGTGASPVPANRGVRLRVGTATPPYAAIDVASATASATVTSGNLTAATAVQSGSWSATTVRGYLGGVAAGPVGGSAGIGNGQPFYLGAMSAAGADAFLGAIHLLCIAPVVMPDADRVAIERFGAYLAGATYVG